ncbi:MAG: hypothetical protein JSS35_03850 [Proteobacteria bacterium]|nr:hypothetical protein [Pseudomonadota bacterium]
MTTHRDDKSPGPPGVVLLICDEERLSGDILGRLHDAGIDARGPFPTARIALAMAGMAAPALVLVARPPTGRRGAGELAREMRELWGVESLLLWEPAQASGESGFAGAIRRLLDGVLETPA